MKANDEDITVLRVTIFSWENSFSAPC